jgi:hypothetical protein
MNRQSTPSVTSDSVLARMRLSSTGNGSTKLTDKRGKTLLQATHKWSIDNSGRVSFDKKMVTATRQVTIHAASVGAVSPSGSHSLRVEKSCKLANGRVNHEIVILPIPHPELIDSVLVQHWQLYPTSEQILLLTTLGNSKPSTPSRQHKSISSAKTNSNNLATKPLVAGGSSVVRSGVDRHKVSRSPNPSKKDVQGSNKAQVAPPTRREEGSTSQSTHASSQKQVAPLAATKEPSAAPDQKVVQFCFTQAGKRYSFPILRLWKLQLQSQKQGTTLCNPKTNVAFDKKTRVRLSKEISALIKSRNTPIMPE